MNALRRGVVAVVLMGAVVGGASAATAQQQPYDTLSMSPAAVPGATVGYRLGDEAVVVVVPDAGVDVRTIDQAIWTMEPMRFRFLEVRTADQVLVRQSYTELGRILGKRPAGLEMGSLRSLSDSLGRISEIQQGTPLKWLTAIVFAVLCVVVAVMLVVVLFVLVDAQWRRTRAREDGGIGRVNPSR